MRVIPEIDIVGISWSDRSGDELRDNELREISLLFELVDFAEEFETAGRICDKKIPLHRQFLERLQLNNRPVGELIEATPRTFSSQIKLLNGSSLATIGRGSHRQRRSNCQS